MQITVGMACISIMELIGGNHMKHVLSFLVGLVFCALVASVQVHADSGETEVQWYQNRIRELQATVDIFNEQIHKACWYDWDYYLTSCVTASYTSAANLLRRATWKYESLSQTIDGLEQAVNEVNNRTDTNRVTVFDRKTILAWNSGFVNQVLGYLETAQQDLKKCQGKNR
jgi:hypothetical protein